MNIQHNPLFDVKQISEMYSEKEGVPVHYVCTSAFRKHAAYAADIFYRETPHPEFGNKYFGIFQNPHCDDVKIMITHADAIESFDFDMAEVDGVLHYSQHRHDFRSVGNGVSIDGGRSYFRALFDDPKTYTHKTLKVKDGKFVVTDK